MALTESLDLPLGTLCPDFHLPTVDGKTYARDDARGAAAVAILFICNHCPYVQAIEDRLIALRQDYASRGVQLIGICSNDPTDYADDAPPRLLARWREKAYGFPYLIDAGQDVARAFKAVCTPDLYVFDRDLRLAYHGRLDDQWKEPSQVTRHELRAALDALLAGQPAPIGQQPSLGCSIKWKKGA